MPRTFLVRVAPALIVAAIVLCPGPGLGLAQQGEQQETPAGETEEQEADQVLESAKRQYVDFLERAGDIMTRSVMTTSVRSGTLSTTTVAYYRGEKSRVETVVEFAGNAPAGGGGGLGLEMTPMETTSLNDGEDIWLVEPGKPKRKLQGEQADPYKTEHDWWDKIPGDAKIDGEEEIGGRDCYIVRITLRKGVKAVTAWLDKETLVFVGGEGPHRGKHLRWVNSDFREVEGRQVPYRTDFFVGDKAAGSLAVESFETDADLSDDLFDPTKPLSAQDRAIETFQQQAEQAQE